MKTKTLKLYVWDEVDTKTWYPGTMFVLAYDAQQARRLAKEAYVGLFPDISKSLRSRPAIHSRPYAELEFGGD